MALTSVLIANRGEIARRVTRAARARGLRVVAVCSRADATAPFVREADTTVLLSGDTLAETYLNIDAIVAAARGAGVDAVHPGYGFLAENADFAAAVTAAGLTYLGPNAKTVALMGSKVAAKDAARAADVPVLPDAVVGADVREADLFAAGESVGYPMLVKASAGGGGRGMRPVAAAGELVAAVSAARSEALAAFGDGTVFLERYLASARHVEVQVIADRHGNVFALGDRECSVQRRHQKLIEEAPAVCIPAAARETIAAAAARLTSKIGYEGVGTCEFLVEGADAFFLEMNTRLQVEHTVTEEVTGLDLVDLQFAVATGARLNLTPDQLEPRGVAVQARLCAEDPAAGWVPSTGTVWRYRHPEAPWLRGEHGIVEGDAVTPAYDSMVAKVIASGPTREIALARLADALARAEVAGVATNRLALAAVLRHPVYVEGAAVDTSFLDRYPEVTAAPEPTTAEIAAAALGLLADETAADAIVPTLPTSWRWGVQPARELELVVAGEPLPVRLTPVADRLWSLDLPGMTSRAEPCQPADGLTSASAGRHPAEVEVLADRSEGRERTLLLRVGAEVAEWTVARRGPARDIDADEVVVRGGGRAIALGVAPRFRTGRHDTAAAGPVSSLPGTVVEVRVAEGETVAAGAVLAVVEAMKMQHPITAPYDAVVTSVLVTPGQAVEAHQLLLELTETEGAG
ncbi:biotin carboxylase N-terminal domain-containing protein [Sporichthya brevicatena]